MSIVVWIVYLRIKKQKQMDKIKLAQRTIALLSSMIESGESHTARTKEMKNNALNGLDEVNKLLKHSVVRQSEQFICRDCEKASKEYRDQLCEPCHKWHTDS